MARARFTYSETLEIAERPPRGGAFGYLDGVLSLAGTPNAERIARNGEAALSGGRVDGLIASAVGQLRVTTDRDGDRVRSDLRVIGLREFVLAAERSHRHLSRTVLRVAYRLVAPSYSRELVRAQDLADAAGVGVATARRAMKALRDSGLLATTRTPRGIYIDQADLFADSWRTVWQIPPSDL